MGTGISTPDISLLIPLAKLLQVSAGELLSGEKEPEHNNAEQVINQVVDYSKESFLKKTEKIKHIAFVSISAACVLAAFVCVLCNYAIDHEITWSFIVMISLLLGWFILMPLLVAKEKPAKKALVTASLLIIPYLGALSWILDHMLVLKMGACIALVGILGMWCIYAVWKKYVHRKIKAVAIILLIAIPLFCGINGIVDRFIESNRSWQDTIFNIMTTFLAALFFFVMDYFMNKRKEKE